ncbi:MAG: hypothetical protein Kow0031_08850 [Anaerolineae bacterium]
MPPYLLLSAMLGATYGVLFHLWRGQTMRDGIIYLLTGIIGFVAGQVIGNLLGLDLLMIGSIHIVEATLVSWGGLFFMRWFKPFPEKPA